MRIGLGLHLTRAGGGDVAVPVTLGFPWFFMGPDAQANGSGHLVSWPDVTGNLTINVGSPGAGIVVATDSDGVQFVRFVDRPDTLDQTLTGAQRVNTSGALTLIDVAREYDNDAIAGWQGIENAAGTIGAHLAYGSGDGGLRGYIDTTIRAISGTANDNERKSIRGLFSNGSIFETRNFNGSSGTVGVPAGVGLCDRLTFGNARSVGVTNFANYDCYAIGAKEGDLRGEDLAALQDWLVSRLAIATSGPAKGTLASTAA